MTRRKKNPGTREALGGGDPCEFFDFWSDEFIKGMNSPKPSESCPEPGSHYLVNREPDDKVYAALERDLPDDPALQLQWGGWFCDEHTATLFGSFLMLKEIQAVHFGQGLGPIEEAR